MVLTWTPPADLDLAVCTERYTRWGADPVNVVADGSYHRCLPGPAGTMVYRATQNRTGAIEITTSGRGDPDHALEDLQARLGGRLPRDPLTELAERDQRVAALISRFPGYRPPITPDAFESLITSITAQQVNLRWALTTRRRLVERYGRPQMIDGVTVWEFPVPAAIAAADPTEIRSLQFTTRKAEYIVGLAVAAMDGALDGLDTMTNTAVIERLVSIRGIGRWSAEWLLARCLARPDAVAAGDLGVRKAVSFSYLQNEHILSESVVRDTTSAWGDAANWTAHLLLETLV